MAIKETLKQIVEKVLSIGTPPEKEVLYKEVIKRKVPQKSAEALVLEDIKNSIKKIWTPEEDIEFARGTANPPVKKAVKKKTPAKKSTSTKKSTPKKPATKKTVTKKTTAKTTSTKKSTTTKKKEVTKKETVKKVPAKKSTSTKKTTDSKSTTTKKTNTETAKAAEKKATTVKKPASTKAEAKKPSIKKETEKKTVAKKTTTAEKKSPTKKTVTKKPTTKKESASKQKATTTRRSKREEKIALYIKDIKKHYGEVDEAFVAIVVKNLGPAIYRKDAELVSCSDPKELDTVRRNFLIRKLGLDAGKTVLDAAIQDVCEELKGVRTKYRATFYYALAKKFKKESALQ